MELDPQAVMLAKSIRRVESGDNFTAKGKSGEYGAYQFTEPTWKTYAKQYGITASLKDATPQQQNEVAYKKIKEWKDAGHNVGQIASMWNAGEKRKDAYLQDFRGTNDMGVKYDVPAYAKSVATAYQTFKSGGQAVNDGSNPSSVIAPQETPQAPQPVTEPEKPGLVKGLVQGAANATGLPKLVASGVGLLHQVGGLVSDKQQALADSAKTEGVDLGLFGGKVKPLGASGNAKKDLTEAISTGVKAGLTAATASSLFKTVLGKFGASKAVMNNPVVKNAFGEITKEALPAISNTQKFDMLSRAIQTASPTEKIILEKALGQIAPSVAKELGVPLSKLIPMLPQAIKNPGLLRQGLKLGLLAEGGRSIFNSAKGLFKNYAKQEIMPQEQTIEAAP